MSHRANTQDVGADLLGYRVEELVGRGGMGVVYLAWDGRLKRHVAVKLIAPELSRDPRFRERFLVESELAASLEHPHVVPVYDAGEADGRLAIAMRFVRGTDLRQLLAAEAPLAPARALAICAQIADALDAAHERGLVHRDVKPSNVLLDERERAYLTDFGLSAQISEQRVREGRSLGTAAYAAPEQIHDGPVDGRADVYALGCVLFECLTGEPPYRGDRELAVLWAHLEQPPPAVSARNPTLPAALDEVVARALAKDPAERHATCGDLVEAAREALGLHDPVTVRRRVPLLLTLAGALLTLALAGVAVLLATSDEGSLRTSTKPTLTPAGDSLQRIDPRTNALVATTRLGPQASKVAVGLGAAYVLDGRRLSVSRIDLATNEVTATSGAGMDALDLVAGAGAVWVRGFETFLVRLDPRTLATTQSSSFSGLGDSGAFWGGERSAVAGAGVVWVSIPGALLRVGSDDIVRRFARLPPIHSNLIAAGGGSIWLQDFSASLFRVDARTGAVLARIPLDLTPVGMAADSTGVWLVDRARHRVQKIGLATNRVVARIPVGREPLAVAAGAGSAWVANVGDGTVTRIDARTNRVLATIRVGPRPTSIAASDDGVWVIVHKR
jgi:serine/threonine-protein kinase